MFQLNKIELSEISRSQNATLKQGKNIKYLPFVFTEHGVAMLSGILKSNLVDHTVTSGKTIQLSREVRRLSEIFDQFQDTHIILKRPDESFNEG